MFFLPNHSQNTDEYSLPLRAPDQKEFTLSYDAKYQELYIKPYDMGTHQNRLHEMILMSTHNIRFGRELVDLQCHHSLLSGALPTVILALYKL